MSATGERIKVTRVVMEGSGLCEGRAVVKKLRALNNFFSTSQHIHRLQSLQSAHGLPRFAAMTDVDVRVASTCKVMKRSIVNYPALNAFFQNVDRPNAFSAISSSEWALIVEIEAATDYIARLALVEVQKESMVASYLPVFRRSALNVLNSSAMMCYELEGARDEHTNERNLKRVKRDCSSFSDPGRRCITRLQEQLIERFSIIDEDTLISLFCDPRTKDVVGSIILDADKQDIPSTSSGALVESARQKFIDEHLKVFKLMSAARHPTPNSDGSRSPSSSSLIHDLHSMTAPIYLAPPFRQLPPRRSKS